MKRDAVLQVRVTQEEKEWAEALAEEFGQKTSDYARACILVGPTPSKAEVDEIEEVGGEAPGIASTEAPQDFAVPEDATREDYVRYLYERITELHRDVERRWPGVTARHQAGEEWKLVREGKPLEKIPQRGNYVPVPPTTYRTS